MPIMFEPSHLNNDIYFKLPVLMSGKKFSLCSPLQPPKVFFLGGGGRAEIMYKMRGARTSSYSICCLSHTHGCNSH